MKVSEVVLALSLLIHGVSATFDDGKLCYILDAILVIYGIVLTVLYCRLRMHPAIQDKTKTPDLTAGAGEGIYQGLTPHDQDTYETIKMKT